MARRTESVTIAFVDTILNVAVSFLALFVVAFLLITPKKTPDEAGKVTPKAEFMITLDWDENSHDDLDLWMRDASGKYVGFSNKESPTVFLDKDDLGSVNDSIVENGVTRIIKINREVMTVRAISPGRYIMNVHVYNRIRNDTFPIKATLRVVKLNPYKIVATTTHTFEAKGEERTVITFEMTDKGEITNIDYDSQEQFIGRGR